MAILLIYIGIALVPFFIWPGFDSRFPKEILGLALSISLVAIYKGQLRPFKNFWFLLFILFSFLCILMAPHFKEYVLAHINGNKMELLLNRPTPNLWMFKSSYYFMVYFLMFVTVASLPIREYQVKNILTAMAVCGVLMSLYVFVQAVGFDPIFKISPNTLNPDIKDLDRPNIGGFMGQATVVAPFIAMTVPLCLYLRRYVCAGVSTVAVVLTMSKVGLAALVIGVVFFLMSADRKFYKLAVLMIFAGALITCSTYLKDKNIFYPKQIIAQLSSESSGRFEAWTQIVELMSKDIEGRKRLVAGIGPGSFPYFFSVKNNNTWWQAHCDPMELVINFGLIGAGLFFFGIRRTVINAYQNKNNMIFGILASLLVLVSSSFGTFSLQMAPNIFDAIVLAGLLNNNSFLKREII